jgi:outer membrane murein-binding lipoprotein Lpp
MTMKVHTFRTVFAVIPAVALMAGCASTPEGSVLSSACPDWVNKDGGAFPDQTDKLFATGAVSGISNVSLARNTADSRARTNLQAVLNTYVKGMVEDYQRATSDGQSASEEMDVTQATRTIVEGTLTGSKIVDRCDDREAGVLYSLATLDLAWMSQFLEKQQSLSAGMRDYIRANAQAALDRLDAATAKPTE